MLSYIAMGAAAVAIYRIAEMDNERAGLWAALTVAVSVGLSFVMPGFFAAFLALVIVFIAMFVKKLRD